MAQPRKFKSAAESRRFKQLGQGLRVSEERIKEQRQGELEGIKLAQLQHKENSNAFLSGLNTKHQFEEGVLREKQGLEQKVREHKYAALAKKAETDVARLEGEYKDKLKKSEWLDQWAPNFAKNMGKLAQGGLHFVDTYRGQKQWEALKESGILDQLTDQKSEANLELSKNITKDGFTLDPDSANALHRKTWKVNTHWASKRLSQWFKENKDLVRSDAIAAFESVDGKYNEHSAVEVQKWNAYTLLKRVGISPTSAGGKEIMELATQMGRLDRKTFAETRRVGETESRIELHLKGMKGVDINSADFTLKIHELSNLYKNGWFKDDNGRVSSPHSNPRSIADGIELGITSYIEANIDSLDMEDVDAILKIATPIIGKDDKAIPFDERHVTRAEGIRDNYLKLKKKQLEKLESEKEVKGLTTYSALKEKFDGNVWNTDPKYKDLEDPYGKWLADTIKLISTDKNYTDKTRNLAYELISFNPKNHNVAGVVSYIKSAFIEGDFEGGIAKYNTLSTSQKEQVASEVELFQKLNDSGFSYNQKGGMTGVNEFNRGFLERVQGSTAFGTKRELSPSALETLKQMNMDFVDRFEEAIANGESPAAATKIAQQWITTEWDKGDKGAYPRVEPDDPKEAFVTYPNKMDRDALLATRYGQRKDWANEDTSKVEYELLDSNTVESYTKSGPLAGDIPNFESAIDVLKHARLTNPAQLNTLSLQLQNLKINSSNGSVSVADLDIPPNVEVFLKNFKYPPGYKENGVELGGKPMTKVKAIKTLFDLHGIEYPEGLLEGADARDRIQADIPGYKNDTNHKAYTMYNTTINQRQLPTRKNVRTYLNALDNGVDSETALLDIFSERTGIKWTKLEGGGYAFNDTKEVLLNDGLNLPLNTTPMQLLENLGFKTKLEKGKSSEEIFIHSITQPSLI